MTDDGFSLSAEKTVLTLFTTGKYNKEDIYTYIHVTIDNLHIYASPFVKYLGVYIDQRLTWSTHISNLLNKAKTTHNLPRVARATPGLNHPKNLITLVQSLIRSRISYGQEAFYAACPSLLSKLQSFGTQLTR
jgi:hypothetical protein